MGADDFRGTPVTSVDDLIHKYGTHSIDLAVSQFIKLAPDFKGDKELAGLLGEMMADLVTALSVHAAEKRERAKR